MLPIPEPTLNKEGKVYRVCEPSTTITEITQVLHALDNNQISSTAGVVEVFEEVFAKKIGTKHAIAVSSGGAALYLALDVLGIGKGDKVIVPDFTMVAAPNAVSMLGATPVFVDAEWDTGNIDIDKIKIDSDVKGIIPTHIYGHPCDMDRIVDEFGDDLFIIEDCAEAHGATVGGKNVGSIGDLAIFSGYANKIIALGEGGVITTDNDEYAEELRKLRGYYFSNKRHFWHERIALNFRLSSLQAAYGIGQIARWDELVEARIQNATLYTKYLKGLDLDLPIEHEGYKNVYWMYFIRTRGKQSHLRTQLARRGIETRTAFIPMHLQPVYSQKGDFATSEMLMREGLYLPSSPNLKEEDIKYISQQIREIIDAI